MTLCFTSNRIPVTWHGVTQRGHTPTRFSPTTTTLIFTTITLDVMGCLRTSLARANHRFQSWWQQKIWAVCVEINYRPFAFLLVLCCHQWKATAKVKHQTCAANKPLVCTVCWHKLDTAFSFCSLFLWMGPPLIFALLHVGSQALCDFRTNFWYMITTRNKWRTACHHDPVYTPKKKKYDLFIQLESLIFFSVYIPPFISPQTVLPFHGKHTVP